MCSNIDLVRRINYCSLSCLIIIIVAIIVFVNSSFITTIYNCITSLLVLYIGVVPILVKFLLGHQKIFVVNIIIAWGDLSKCLHENCMVNDHQ